MSLRTVMFARGDALVVPNAEYATTRTRSTFASRGYSCTAEITRTNSVQLLYDAGHNDNDGAVIIVISLTVVLHERLARFRGDAVSRFCPGVRDVLFVFHIEVTQRR